MGGMGFRGRIAKWWGLRHGFTQRGGHIYNQQGEMTWERGWRGFYDRYKQEIWAELWPDEGPNVQDLDKKGD